MYKQPLASRTDHQLSELTDRGLRVGQVGPDLVLQDVRHPDVHVLHDGIPPAGRPMSG